MSLLDDIEKAITQLLIAHGTVEDSKLTDIVESLRRDFPSSRVRTLRESFARINLKMKNISMQIKSIGKSKCCGCDTITNSRPTMCDSCSDPLAKSEWVFYHALVNTEEDTASKEVGTELKADEIQFFSKLTLKLVEENYLSTDDIYRIRMEKWNPSDTDVVLEKLKVKGWLQRDERSFWEIGKWRAFTQTWLPSAVVYLNIYHCHLRIKFEFQNKRNFCFYIIL